MLQTEISRQATVATVLEGIRQDAILGKFSGEKQISETEIAQQYQVSRSSVRSAFQILERDGLITVQPNGRKLLKKGRKIYRRFVSDQKCSGVRSSKADYLERIL